MLVSIRKIMLVCLLVFVFPFTILAEENKERMPEKPLVPDSILQNIFQFSPFYSKIIDEYKADLYMKGRVKVHKSKEEYRQNQNSTSINHFYEKLLLLKDMMNTDAAKRIAEHRQAIMEAYLEEFMLEWEGER